MAVRWNKMLIFGHKEIDEEHKEIIKAARQVFKAIKVGDEAEIDRLLKQFEVLVRDHFRSEEAIMEQYKLSQLGAHRQLHENYLELLSEIYDTYFNAKSISLLKKNFTTACHVMTKHIINYDIPVFTELQRLIGQNG